MRILALTRPVPEDGGAYSITIADITESRSAMARDRFDFIVRVRHGEFYDFITGPDTALIPLYEQFIDKFLAEGKSYTTILFSVREMNDLTHGECVNGIDLISWMFLAYPDTMQIAGTPAEILRKYIESKGEKHER